MATSNSVRLIQSLPPSRVSCKFQVVTKGQDPSMKVRLGDIDLASVI